jgi:hypothetical protein
MEIKTQISYDSNRVTNQLTPPFGLIMTRGRCATWLSKRVRCSAAMDEVVVVQVVWTKAGA